MQGNGIIPIREGQIPPEVASYMGNTQMMYEIVRAMKEIPELESEKPTDTNALVKVEFPEEGGILTYMSNHEYPYRGFPYFEFVEKIDTIKKLSRGVLSGLYHALKGNKLKAIFAIPLIFVGRELITAGIYTYYKLIERFRIKSNLYSKAIRELYRTFSVPRAGENTKILELRLLVRDLICIILEFDNAYRYRFQDIIVELNKEAIKTKPIKELIRLLDVMSQRENDQKVKDSWWLLKMVIRLYLRFDRKLLKMFSDVLSQLNLAELVHTPQDKHYSCLRNDYRFGFMTNPTPEDRALIDRTFLMREYHEKRGELDGKLVKEISSQQACHASEQAKVINLSPEIQKKIQEETASAQKTLMEQYNAIAQNILFGYLGLEQKELLKKQEEEKVDLMKEHDLRRSGLAASYGL